MKPVNRQALFVAAVALLAVLVSVGALKALPTVSSSKFPYFDSSPLKK